MTESFDLGSLIEEFRDEAREQVDGLDGALLRYEREGALDQEPRRDLLRGLHTLKGNAGMLGLAPVRDFVHVLESILKGGEPGIADVADRLFEGAAALRRAVEAAGRPEEEEAFRELTAMRRRLEELDPAAEQESSRSASADEELVPGSGEDRIRVPFAKLDVLLSEVGELRAEADALVRAVAEAPREDAGERAAAMHRRGARLYDTVLELRLVPLGRVFGRFHGLVRRLAREQEKEARLVVEGESTEVDKSTADALAEPLLHLIRNGIDHGIEPPDTREATGKPRHGTIRIRARQEGDRVRIAVEDDGAGLDLDAVRARAREAGLLAADETVSDDDATDLIFRPGLSTRREVSAVSGRGVGLDVVRRSVRLLRGELHVERPAEGGTRLLMRLPLTVASVPSVIFETGGQTLAVPAFAVDRTLRLERVERVGNTEVVRDGDRLVPLVDPSRLFHWPDSDRGDFGVQLRAGRGAAVLSADRLLEQRDLVVKALPAYGGRPVAVSGASVAPGGRVILLLDPAEVIELSDTAWEAAR